jgi:hypothetical protein
MPLTRLAASALAALCLLGCTENPLDVRADFKRQLDALGGWSDIVWEGEKVVAVHAVGGQNYHFAASDLRTVVYAHGYPYPGGKRYADADPYAARLNNNNHPVVWFRDTMTPHLRAYKGEVEALLLELRAAYQRARPAG